MHDPLNSIPDYCISQLKNIQQLVQNSDFVHKQIAFSNGFMLPETEEYKERMQAISKDFDLVQEFVQSNHPWAIEALTINYWKHLKANQPENAGSCAMHLGIDKDQMSLDLIKAQVYTFLEEIGLQYVESLAEEMAVKIIRDKDTESVFRSYIKNGVIEFEEDESNLDQTQTDDEWECEYCGAVFNSLEEASRHEEVCELNYDEENDCQEGNKFDEGNLFKDY